MLNTCPVCGYDQLSVPPYARYAGPIAAQGLHPPYEDALGRPSYEVCNCCGFEFGNDDNPGAHAQPESFESYRTVWMREGAPWLDSARRPLDWSAGRQLVRAGLGPQTATEIR